MPPGPGKKFEKGHAGMGGRPKVPSEFKEKCRAFTPQVFDAWVREIQSQGEHWMKASELLVAYAEGRPAQAITAEDGGALEVVIRTVSE